MPSRCGTGENADSSFTETSELHRTSIDDFLFPFFSRRWFSIQNSQLVYQKKLKAGSSAELLASAAFTDCCFRRNEQVFVRQQDSLTVVVDDLRLCSVKPFEDIERRFCFEVVSPFK